MAYYHVWKAVKNPKMVDTKLTHYLVDDVINIVSVDLDCGIFKRNNFLYANIYQNLNKYVPIVK